MCLKYIIIIDFVISELLSDSQDSYLQIISQDKFKGSFSIWFKQIQSQDKYDVISFYSDQDMDPVQDQYFETFIGYDQFDSLQICISPNNCRQIGNNQEYQNPFEWIHFIISKYIKIELPLKTIELNTTFQLEYPLVLRKSLYYRCLIYDRVSQIQQRILKQQYEKLVRPPERLQLFTQKSSIQIFLKQHDIQSNDEEDLLALFCINLFSIQFVDLYGSKLQINDDIISNIPNYQLNKWFQIQFIINYEVIQFILVVDDYRYTREYQIKLGKNIPLYYFLALNLGSNNFVIESSNYYQFYNQNEINLCHSYCKDCNIICQSCYVDNCSCQKNQFFDTINKKCQYYSQLPNLDLVKLPYKCKREFQYNKNTNQCESNIFKYEGFINKQAYFGENNEKMQFSLIEDLKFRKNFLDTIQATNNLQSDQSYDFKDENFEVLPDQSLLILKVKNIMIIYIQSDGLQLCRHKYFGNQCQYKLQKCLKSENKNCLFCQPNYILMGKKCYKCPYKCLICSYSKKKLICLLQQEGYQINKYGLIKKCINCYFCNQSGCVSEYQFLKQVKYCQENRLCYKDINFSCNDRSQFIIDLAQQECQQFSLIQLQSIQSIIQMDEYFLGNYESSFIYQLIFHSMTFNNTDIFQNQQVSQIFRFEQLKLLYFQKLSDKFSEQEDHYLQKNGYICKQKYLHNNSVRCISYDYDTNLYNQNLECRSNSTCQYNLTLTDVNILIGDVNIIYYENHDYDDLGDLIISIYNIGFDFRFININASVTFNLPMNQKEKVYDSQYMLQIHKKDLPLRYLQTQFVLNISYVHKGYTRFKNRFLLNIVADYVQINNLVVDYTLDIFINCSELFLYNTEVYKSSFTLIIVQGKIATIQNTLIANVEESNYLEFNLLHVNQLISISKFQIIQSQLRSVLFKIQNIQNIKLYQIHIFESSLHFMSVFEIIFVQKLQALDIVIDDVEMHHANLITYNIGHIFMIGIVNINKIFASGFNMLFQIEGLKEVSFENLNIHNSTINTPQVLLIQVQEQLLLENIYLQLDAHQFLQFQGDVLIINELKVYQQGSQSIKILNSFSSKVLINVIEYQSYNGAIDIQQFKYLIQIVSITRCLINNIKIKNIISTGYGIFYLQNSNFMQLQNITINNCLLQVDHQQINIFLIQNEGRSIFYNIQIWNISINKNLNNQPMIFRINGINDNLFMKNITIRNITSKNLDNLIFYLNNKKSQIVGLFISDTHNIQFFYLKSQDTFISKLLFINNSQTEQIFCIAQKNLEYISFINIKDLYVYNLSGYLINHQERDKNYVIQLEDIHVRLVSFHAVAYISLTNTILQIKNFLIEEQGQINNLQKQMFMFNYLRAFLYNISISNLNLCFGQIFYPQQIEMKGIFITNVKLVDYEDMNQPFLSILIDQNVIFSDILITNSSFIQFEWLVAYILRGSLILKDFQIINVQFNNTLIGLRIFNYSNIVRMNNFISQNLEMKNLIFLQSEFSNSLILMNKIHISNCSGYILETDTVIKFQINESLLINTENIFNLEQNISLVIQDSEIINHQQQSFLETPIEKSFIFDDIRQQNTITRPFGVSLSFDFGKTLLSTRRLQKNVYQIAINNNISSYFYLPTGQIINKYQRFQLKQLEYNQIYKGFSIVAQGLDQLRIQCNLTSSYNGQNIEVFNQKELILQEGINMIDNLTSVINPFNQDYVQNEIQCSNYALRFNTKGFRCQLGEFIFNNQCLQCDISRGLYSTKYNSTHCYNVNYNQIEQLKIGLIKLRQNYWRYNYSTIYIEECLDDHLCNGGWRPGDQSCNQSRIGAMCQECDIYNHLGYGHFTKNINICQICEVTYRLIYQMLFSILWQLLLTFMNIYSKDTLSKQFLIYKVGFSNFYQVLYRLSIDQPSVILKMFLNYIFQIYLIRQNFDTLGQILVLNINYMNNPNLIMQAQLDCLFIQVQNVEVIYSQLFFSLCNLFFILSLEYFIYLILVKFKVTVFSIRFFFLATVETFIFNLKIILEISFKLLTYQEISKIKWITSNLANKYYSTIHIMWMVNYIIPITCTVIFAPMLMMFLLKLNIMKVFSNIQNIYKKIQKTFSLFQQAYKDNCFFWEYIIIYVRLVFILISIINREQLQFTTYLCLSLLFILYHQQPYYLKNLNNFDYRLLLFFTIITQILILTNNAIVLSLILVINLYIIMDAIKFIVRKSIQLNRSKIFDYKSKVTNKFPQLKKISGLESDLRTINNQILIKSVIRKKYLSRKNSEVGTKSLIPKHEIFSQGNEIELGTIKSSNSE